MSHVSVKHASGTEPVSLAEFLATASTLLATSITNTSAMLEQASGLFRGLPALSGFKPTPMCEIPETECPPRCVCHATWEARAGETPALTVRVRNASKVARTFSLSVTPFTGASGSLGTIALAPTSLSLKPGQSGVVDAKFTVPQGTAGDYQAEIMVHGVYEQCVEVSLRISEKKTCGDERCTCEVVQGDLPVRIRAHHWYDHFQCTESCGDPAGRGGHDG